MKLGLLSQHISGNSKGCLMGRRAHCTSCPKRRFLVVASSNKFAQSGKQGDGDDAKPQLVRPIHRRSKDLPYKQHTVRQESMQTSLAPQRSSNTGQISARNSWHQKGALLGLSHPRQINTSITQQMKAAMGAVRGRGPRDAMFAFLANMQELSNVTASSMNYINISTIFSATAKVWVAARRNPQFAPVQQEAYRHVMALLASLLQMLQPMMPQMDAQAVSNILWSSAKMGIHLDSLAPGVTHGLMTRFLQLAAAQDTAKQPTAQATANLLWAVATVRLQLPSHVINRCCAHFDTLINSSKQPSAQHSANMLWAVATMKHQLASHVIDKCCAHFVTLINSSRVADRPDSQNITNFIWAVATLEHVPSDRGFLSCCCTHFSQLIGSRAIAEQPNAQETANLLWALATSEFEPSESFLGLCCNHLSSLISSLAEADHPNAQCISNALWALYKFKYAPPGQIAKAMLDRMVALCLLPGQQPTAQAISNVMLACAHLRLAVDSVGIERLVAFFLNMSKQTIELQAYTNLAWSLAVLGLLHIETLTFLLCGLSDEAVQHNELLEGKTSSTTTAHLTQLYHALDWLQPLPGAAGPQHQAWSQLRAKLNRLGPPPPVTALGTSWPHESTGVIITALTRLRLRFTESPDVKGYRTIAVLNHTESGLPVILACKSTDYIRGQHARWTGREMLRQQLLGREGKLVLLNQPKPGAVVEVVARYLKPLLEAATEGCLDSYKTTVTS